MAIEISDNSMKNAVVSVILGTFSKCGDGWGLFMSDNYKKAAEIFDEICKQELPLANYTIRTEGDSITYEDGDESITFASLEYFIDIDSPYDVIVWY